MAQAWRSAWGCLVFLSATVRGVQALTRPCTVPRCASRLKQRLTPTTVHGILQPFSTLHAKLMQSAWWCVDHPPDRLFAGTNTQPCIAARCASRLRVHAHTSHCAQQRLKTPPTCKHQGFGFLQPSHTACAVPCCSVLCRAVPCCAVLCRAVVTPPPTTKHSGPH
jgi:hypothetical protein